jgi:hypothetical protein
MQSKLINNVSNLNAIKVTSPDLRFQSVGFGAMTYPTGGSFTINLSANSNLGRQTVWDITNCSSTVTCTVNMGFDACHPIDLIFINYGGSKTLNISIPLISASQSQKTFWSDSTQYSGASSKSLTSTGGSPGSVTWLRLCKAMDQTITPTFTHWINVELVMNNRTQP